MVSLKQCRDGYAPLLVPEDHSQEGRNLRKCFQVGSPVVYVHSVEIPEPLRQIFKTSDFPPLKLQNIISSMTFIPRCTVDTVRKLLDQDESEAGLEIPVEVTCLDAVVQPIKLVKQEFEAVAWSQRACFEVQPSPSVCAQYPDLGKPSFSEVVHLFVYILGFFC